MANTASPTSFQPPSTAPPPVSQTPCRANLDTVRAIIFNRATEKTTAEHEAVDVALAETVASKAELAADPNLVNKDGLTLTQLDTLQMELQKRKQTIQRKEREITEFHRRYISQYGVIPTLTTPAFDGNRDDEIKRQNDVEIARTGVNKLEDGSIYESTDEILDAAHTLKAEHACLTKLAQERLAKREATMVRMEEADRILANNNKTLRTISKRHMTELAHYNKPPALVLLCLTAIFDLLGLGKNLDYKKMKVILVKTNFSRTMQTFDTSTVTKRKLDRLEAAYFSLPEFTVEKMKRASELCGILTKWLLSLRNVCKVFHDTAVHELRKELSVRQTMNIVDNDVAGIRGADTGNNRDNGIGDKNSALSGMSLVLSFIDSATFAHVDLELTEFLREETVTLVATEEAKAESVAEEAKRLKLEEEVQIAAEEAAKVKAAATEEAKILKDEEQARVKAVEDEAAKIVAEAEAKAKAAVEEAKRLKLEEETQIAADEAAKVKAAAAEEAKILKDEEDARVKAAEEEALRIQAEEEEAAKIVAEAEAKSKAAAEEAKQLKAEEEARIKAEEKQEAMRIHAAKEAKIAAETEAKAIAVAAAAAAAEESERLRVEEETKIKADEEEKVAARLQAEEEAKIAAEEEAKAKAAAEEAKRLKLEKEAKITAEGAAKVKTAAAKEAKILKDEEEARMKATEEKALCIQAEEEAKIAAKSEAKSKAAAEEAKKLKTERSSSKKLKTERSSSKFHPKNVFNFFGCR